MKRLTIATILAALCASAPVVARLSPQRQVPLNSSTPVVFSRGPTLAGETAGASVDTDTMTLGASASTTADAYNGLDITVYGCADTSMEGTYHVTDYATNKQADFTPAAATAPDPNCSVSVGPALPSRVTSICFGGASGTIYYSETPNGASSGRTEYYVLTGGQSRCLTPESPTSFVYVEMRAVSATDTIGVDVQTR